MLVNQVTEGVDSSAIQIIFIIMLWVLLHIVWQISSNPVHTELSKFADFGWLVIEKLVRSPDNLSSSVYNVSSSIDKIALRIDLSAEQVFALKVVFARVTQDYLLRVLVSLKLSNDFLDFVSFSIEIVELSKL